MSKFFVGQRVRLIRGQDHLDYEEMATIGEVGEITSVGRYFPDPEDSYDWIVAFPSYPSLCCYQWQLEPADRAISPTMDKLQEAVA